MKQVKSNVENVLLENTIQEQKRRAKMIAFCVLKERTTILKGWVQHALLVQVPQFQELHCAKHVSQDSTRKKELSIALIVLLESSQMSLIH
jgi:hypothetical protein